MSVVCRTAAIYSRPNWFQNMWLKICIYNRFRSISIKLRDVLLNSDVTAVRSEILTAFEKELMKIETQ